MDRVAWWATVHRVVQSWTDRSNLVCACTHTHTHTHIYIERERERQTDKTAWKSLNKSYRDSLHNCGFS